MVQPTIPHHPRNLWITICPSAAQRLTITRTPNPTAPHSQFTPLNSLTFPTSPTQQPNLTETKTKRVGVPPYPAAIPPSAHTPLPFDMRMEFALTHATADVECASAPARSSQPASPYHTRRLRLRSTHYILRGSQLLPGSGLDPEPRALTWPKMT